ncbi:unnamed protein product, partial [Mesorhabditis spiculigera]
MSRQATQFKQFLRLVARWPKDPLKSEDRQLAFHLDQQIQRFKKDPTVFGDDAAVCDKRYAALERIVNNDVFRQYPHNYTSGCFGLNLEKCKAINGESGRQTLGFGRESRWKALWNKLFPKPADYKGK